MSDDEKTTPSVQDAADAELCGQTEQSENGMEAAADEMSVADDIEAVDETNDEAAVEPAEEDGDAADEDSDCAENAEDADPAPEETAPAQDFVPADHPAGIPVLEDVATTVSDTQNIPRFLTREQYEQVGDDPDPLPAGFEVIEGGAGADAAPETEAQLSPAVEETSESPAATAAQTVARAGAAVADAAASIGSMLSQGAGAVREVNAAKRAHAEARDQLDELSRVIGENEEELNHRRDVESRYDEILAEQTARREAAVQAVAAAKAAQTAICTAIDDMKSDLDRMKEADSACEKSLKAALEAAETKEDTARESANRLVRRVTDAQRRLDAAKTERDTKIAAAQKAVDDATSRLETLREEFAGIQRNPSLNSADYSVRATDLQASISDATAQLRQAQAELPGITKEANQSIADAEAALKAANEPIEEARASFREVSDSTATARDALDTAKKDADTRQKALRAKIAEQEKLRRAQEKAQKISQADADDAAAQLADIADIHTHPEITQQLASRIQSDRAYRTEQLRQVENLAETEQSIREQTRASRLRFLGVLAGIIVAAAILAALWGLLTGGGN